MTPVIRQLYFLLLLLSACSHSSSTNGEPPPVTDSTFGNVSFWLTKPDGSTLLASQSALQISTKKNDYPNLDIDTTQSFQSMEGFGYTLTGGSAMVINKMNANDRSILLNELFGNSPNSIGVSFLRISIGASDLDSAVFSYDDLPPGQTDLPLTHFTLDPDRRDLIPLLKEILTINPDIHLLATPWSPPVWMKDNGSSIGGTLKAEYYPVYAQYLVKYIQGMEQEGIRINAITPQNEPLNPSNNPSLSMTADLEADFIKNHLGPAFHNAGIATRIIIYDHNCDRPDYPISILNEDGARQYVDGSAFHLYAGNISSMSSVHDRFPDKNVYFTEQYTASNGDFGGDLQWHIKNLVIGAPRNWARTVLEWNLANDESFGPHTAGGCNTCKGALTITGSFISRNVAYYIIAHASKFVKPGSMRIQSSDLTNLPNVAFKTPDGKKVLIVLNESTDNTLFNIRSNGKWAVATLPGGSVATFVW